MPKAQVSVLEVAIEASASSALAALDKLEEKLNTVGGVLDTIVSKAGQIKALGAIAEGFKGIAAAAKEVEKLAKSADNAKRSAKTLDDVFEKFSTVGRDWKPSERLGLKELSNLSDSYTKKIEAAYDRLDKAQALGIKPGSSGIERIVYDIQNYQNRLEAISARIEELQTNNHAHIADISITGIGHDDAERIEEVSSAMHDLDDAVVSTGQAFAGAAPLYENVEAEVEALMSGIESLDDVFDRFGAAGADWKPAEGLGLKDLERMARSAEKQIENLYAKIEKYQAFGITPNDKKMQNAVYDLSVMLNHYDAIKEAIAGASAAQHEFTEGTRKVGSAAPKLKSIAEGFKKVFSAIGLGQSHTSKLFGRRGFGGFLSLMVIRRALTSLIRALTGGIKEGSDNLAQYSAEYNNSISRMVSGLNYLKNAWAAAFAPIVNVVAPYVETFINLLASALNAVGRFMAALTGKGFAVQAKSVWTDYAASLDKAGYSAGGAGSKMDDLKKTIMSFDEIHALNDPNSSGGGGGGGAGGGGINPSDMFETVDLAGDSLADFGKILRDRMLAGDWYGVGDAIAEKMNGIIEKVNGSHWGEKLAERINHFIEAYNGWADNFDWEGLGDAIGTSLNDFFLNFSWTGFASGIAKTLNGLLHTFNVFASVTHWKEIGANITLGIETFFKQVEWSEIGTAIKNACDALLDFINGAIEEAHPEEIGAGIADSIIDGIVNFFMGEEESAAFQKIAHALINIFRLLFPTIAAQFQDTYERFAPGHNLYDDILSDIDGFYEDLNERSDTGSQTVMDTVTENVKTPYDDLCRDVVESSGYAVDESQNKWSPFGDWYKDRVTDPLKGHNKKFKDNTIDSAKEAEKGVEYQFKPLDGNLDMKAWKPIQGHANVASGNVAAYFATAAANLQLKWQGITGWFDTNVSTPVSTTFNTLSTKIGNSFTSAKTNLQSGWGNVSSWFQTNVVDPISSVFSGLWKIGSTAATKLRDGLKSISMPTFHITWNTTRKNIKGIVVDIPWPSIAFYAKGGFPSADLFAANESGNPEMVGRIGTRTAVANNNQITEALKDAMLEGLMQYAMVMSNNNDSTPYQINLVVKTQNDEVLARAVERGNARRNARMYPAGAVR